MASFLDIKLKMMNESNSGVCTQILRKTINISSLYVRKHLTFMRILRFGTFSKTVPRQILDPTLSLR